MSDGNMDLYFAFIKDCLLKFNYPLAHSMTEEELGDIFKSSNRCFLISWILKLLDSAYEEVLQNSENDKECLGTIMYELGFCTMRERQPFMTGGLPVDEQVKIIYNLFSFITDIKKSDAENQRNAVSNDELIALKNRNLNLFPMYGDIKFMKSNERCEKLLEYKEELDSIKAKISTGAKVEGAGEINYRFHEIIEEFFAKFKADFPKIGVAIRSLKKDRDLRGKDIIQLHFNSTELMRECSINLKVISQFMKDVIVIRDFVEANAKINELAEEITNETIDMVQSLYQELLSVRKYAKCL